MGKNWREQPRDRFGRWVRGCGGSGTQPIARKLSSQGTAAQWQARIAERSSWGASGNPMMSAIADIQDFNAAPQVLTETGMDAAVRDGHMEIYRGIHCSDDDTADHYFAQLKGAGPFFHGRGTYGDGCYYAVNLAQHEGDPEERDRMDVHARLVGLSCAGSHDGIVARAALPPDAAVIDFDTATEQCEREHQEHQRAGRDLEALICQSPTAWAIAQGYDAMSIPRKYGSGSELDDEDEPDQIVVFNRGILAIQDEPVLRSYDAEIAQDKEMGRLEAILMARYTDDDDDF